MADSGRGHAEGSAGRDRTVSRCPVDQLIREPIATGRPATAAETGRIVERMATAPFEQNDRPMPKALQGTIYNGHPLGPRASSLLVHLVTRVLLNQQWTPDTTAQDYLNDLWRAVRDPAGHLVSYDRRGGPIAGVLSPDALPANRRGPRALPWLYVVYSADRGRIISGYQVNGLAEISIPEGAQWLR